MAETRDLGNNKRTGQQQEKLSGDNVTELSVSSVPRTVTKEDIQYAFEEHGHVMQILNFLFFFYLIQHAFEEHGHVEVSLVKKKNKRTRQQQGMLTHVNIFLG
ncbi:hypothetical protein Hanom_Chr09g00779721 [Helianthus anomalus]